MDFQKRYNLRSKGNEASPNKHPNDQPSTNQRNQEDFKAGRPKKGTNIKEHEVSYLSFSLKHEI